MTREINLVTWLRRRPQPAKLRLDGKKIIAMGTGARKWSEARETLEALSWEQIEALNEDGDVIRVSGGDDEPAKPLPSEGKSREAELAALILEATDRGAQRHAEAMTLAFEKVCALAQTLSDRGTQLEQAWQALLVQRANELQAASPEGGDDAGRMVGSLLTLAAAQGKAKAGK